jgi:hypothetical protein
MAGAATSTRVRGLTELIRAFKGIDDDIVREFIDELAEAAEPARKEAVSLVHEMVNVRPPYDRMKIGVSRGEKKVYMAPDWRAGGGNPRPEMAPHLKKRMQKAVDHNRVAVIKKIREMCDRIADDHGF